MSFLRWFLEWRAWSAWNQSLIENERFTQRRRAFIQGIWRGDPLPALEAWLSVGCDSCQREDLAWHDVAWCSPDASPAFFRKDADQGVKTSQDRVRKLEQAAQTWREQMEVLPAYQEPGFTSFTVLFTTGHYCTRSKQHLRIEKLRANAFEAAVIAGRADVAVSLWTSAGPERHLSFNGYTPSALMVFGALADGEVFQALLPHIPEAEWHHVALSNGMSARAVLGQARPDLFHSLAVFQAKTRAEEIAQQIPETQARPAEARARL